MRLFCVFGPDGVARRSSLMPENHDSERPPPNGYEEGEIGVEVMAAIDGEFNDQDEQMREHFALHDWLRAFTFNGDALEGTEPPEVVPRSRLAGGILEDLTVDGWQPRAILEPELDEKGEPVLDAQGEPKGRWFRMGPRQAGGRPNLQPIDAPGESDRRVRKGPEGRELNRGVNKDGL